jgi:hypothetical protein
MIEEKYCDTSLVYLNPLNKNVAKDLIIKNHYTHKWSLCTIAYGVYYKEYVESSFFGGFNSKLIGVLVYGNAVGRNASTSISPLLVNNNVLELTRVWIADGYGKNIESYCIAESFRQINKDYPKIKCILSYSDSEAGHSGTIYQATGFLYQGDNYVDIALMPNYSVSLHGPPDYNWIHSRTVYSKWKTHNVDKLKQRIGKTFWRKRESGKHRYIKFISNKIDNKKLVKSLKHKVLPYPKNVSFKEQVTEITVDGQNNNTFF